MPTFRLGDRGSAVAEIRSILSGQGLLSSTPGRHAAPESAGTPTPNGPSNGEAAQNGAVIHSTEDALFDIDVDHAVRAFQQQRGLIVDGIVGQATYRSLREASYQLGARVLLYRLSAPMVGDDVATLQSRLQNLGYYLSLIHI